MTTDGAPAGAPAPGSWIDGGGGGAPVVLFHGAPGSRWFRPQPRTPRDVRLVTFDRPGYGAVPPQPGRTVLHAAAQLAALLDHLGIEQAALVGWSGGGPSAVAAAYALPERVRSLAIVSAPGPLDEVPGAWDLLGARRAPTARMARVEPERSRRAIARYMAPVVAQPETFLGSGKGPDGIFLRGPEREMLLAGVHEAFRQGVEGLADDLLAMWLPWGFTLDAVRVPTAVFHGAHDPHNLEDARTYATRIPGASLTIWDDAGHLGVLAHWDEVLDALEVPRA